MDTAKVSGALSVRNIRGFPIHHYAIQDMNIPIANGKKSNRNQTI